MRRATPPRPVGCSAADPWDSRGPGWYCCTDNRYNENKRRTCASCDHRRCAEVKAEEPAEKPKAEKPAAKGRTHVDSLFPEIKKRREAGERFNEISDQLGLTKPTDGPLRGVPVRLAYSRGLTLEKESGKIRNQEAGS